MFGIFSGMQILGIFWENCIIFLFNLYQDLLCIVENHATDIQHPSRHLDSTIALISLHLMFFSW